MILGVWFCVMTLKNEFSIVQLFVSVWTVLKEQWTVPVMLSSVAMTGCPQGLKQVRGLTVNSQSWNLSRMNCGNVKEQSSLIAIRFFLALIIAFVKASGGDVALPLPYEMTPLELAMKTNARCFITLFKVVTLVTVSLSSMSMMNQSSILKSPCLVGALSSLSSPVTIVSSNPYSSASFSDSVDSQSSQPNQSTASCSKDYSQLSSFDSSVEVSVVNRCLSDSSTSSDYYRPPSVSSLSTVRTSYCNWNPYHELTCLLLESSLSEFLEDVQVLFRQAWLAQVFEFSSIVGQIQNIDFSLVFFIKIVDEFSVFLVVTVVRSCLLGCLLDLSSNLLLFILLHKFIDFLCLACRLPYVLQLLTKFYGTPCLTDVLVHEVRNASLYDSRPTTKHKYINQLVRCWAAFLSFMKSGPMQFFQKKLKTPSGIIEQRWLWSLCEIGP